MSESIGCYKEIGTTTAEASFQFLFALVTVAGGAVGAVAAMPPLIYVFAEQTHIYADLF